MGMSFLEINSNQLICPEPASNKTVVRVVLGILATLALIGLCLLLTCQIRKRFCPMGGKQVVYSVMNDPLVHSVDA